MLNSVSLLFPVQNNSERVLHQFPAVRREQQMNRVVLQITFLLQVSADQLSDGCGPICTKTSHHGPLRYVTQQQKVLITLHKDRRKDPNHNSANGKVRPCEVTSNTKPHRGTSSSPRVDRSAAAPGPVCYTESFSRPCPLLPTQ